MISSLYFQYLSSVYLILLIGIYFSKNRIKNIETKIYTKIIFNCVFGVIMDIISTYAAYIGVNHTFLIILCKTYLFFLIFFGYYMGLYLIKIANLKRTKIIEFIYKFGLILFLILATILPLYSHSQNGEIYTYGPSAISVYVYIAICIFFYLTIIVSKWKKITTKKIIPIFSFIFCIITIASLQFFYPQLLIVTSGVVFVTFIMYFTIENPDLKLINQLELAKNSAEKANHAKTDFLSSMSHEIRTPLNAIVGFSQCIENANNLEEAKEDARDIVMASQNLLEIVNGILDISKIEADKMEIVNTEYNLKEILNNLTKLIKARIGEKDIELKTNFAVDLPDRLYGDSGKVKQIITNILTNAAKYTEQGEIEFTVNCLNNQDKSKLIISIRDTGRGIKQEQIDKLFTKFQRLDEDKNTTTEGTGLGLAITKRLVEMMGGKIVVQSEYGEGSIFTVYLTQDIRNGLYEKEEVVEEIISFDNKKVLIVDDNKLNIKVGTKILREYNLDISSAQSGFECINKIENNEKFDIILLDIMMPKMSGVETLKRLKQIEGFNTPVIALTADAIQGKEKKYLEVGFDGYLSKPIDPIELNKILSKYLSYKEEIKIEEEKIENKVNKLDVEYLEENDIDVDSSLELLGDMDMYNDTLKDFLTESETRLPKMKEHLSNEDASNYAILAHAMKSDSKYLGFKKLAELSLDHELKGKENNIEYIKDHYEELMNEVERIINVVKEYLGDE